ncbi:insulin receptor substrate 1-like isoform X4 [Prorops nasuta]|uniref:insulin receptor substrate 1-like isoform X4 n=1 Tax=Prorops nasuta TaxID=863751 RepID=UPI0034CE6AEA
MVNRIGRVTRDSFRNTGFLITVTAMSAGRGLVSPSRGPVVRCGQLKKLKTLKKKFFVLRGDAPGYSACLEYYDSRKKFENRQPPKRSILLHSCFNINKRNDTKHKHVIALYTKDECFCLILDNERDLEDWLKEMLLLQSGDVPDGEQPRPTFEHIWEVTIQKKGLGERKSIHGPYRLCLTDRTLSLVKIGAKDNSDCLEFSLICIRRCGYIDRIFYMEVGRSAVTGGGDFWMEAEDSNIAQNMSAAILHAMSNSSSGKDEVGPRQRMRSSSANEASKPICVLQRRHTNQKLHGFSPLGTSGRDRCDSLPSRARTTSEGFTSSIVSGHPSGGGHFVPHVSRPHSMFGRGLSYSPPVSSMPISPASGACSTDSAGSSLSMDDGGENILEESTGSRYGHSLTPDEPVILEENGDDYAVWSTTHSHHKYSPNFKSHSPSQQSSYVEMYSPCGSSPGRGGNYMPMSPATIGHSHSRASSLVEDTNALSDGYVPMAPIGDDGYVDMDPANNHNGHFPDDMSQHGGSSCSVTSGTPSTDLRFSEYHLDKVASFLTPGDDLQSRPTRAYSVGSRPEPASRYRKNRLDLAQQEASRVRAFSVGSRSKKPEIGRLATMMAPPLLPSSCETSNSNKSNSAPLLSSSWGHNSGCSGASERMEDLMELDFTKPSIPTTLSSPPSSYSQSQSYSNATDSSSYVDMSPGQLPTLATAPYVDMSGMNKVHLYQINRNNNNINTNNNNNNNIITANQNHGHAYGSSSMVPMLKPVITTLKPVEEAEGPYVRMDAGSMEDWTRSESSLKKVPSPMLDDFTQTNGPPGGTRTAPVDFPQPRRPPEGYVEMSFKGRPSQEQDYINMSMNLNRHNRKVRGGSRKDKSRSQPIAIQSTCKSTNAPNFLHLNGSPTSESLASTPASPPRATPTGSSSTIFPFSLNSPQSPVKPFTNQKENQEGCRLGVESTNSDYTMMEPTKAISLVNSVKPSDASNSLSTTVKSEQTVAKDTNLAATTNSVLAKEHTLAPLTKKFSEWTMSKPRLVTASPNTSPTFSGFKTSSTKTKPTSPKLTEETLTPTATPTPTPSPLDNDAYDKLQANAANLHYASLDLPEASNSAPPISPALTQEGFGYAEIDFAKLKQN